jgi:HAE1 family hydrophobic/amphiphilic exporter-1
MEHREAVRESTRTRLRPIFMTALTSVFGMLPLVRCTVRGPNSTAAWGAWCWAA